MGRSCSGGAETNAEVKEVKEKKICKRDIMLADSSMMEQKQSTNAKRNRELHYKMLRSYSQRHDATLRLYTSRKEIWQW